MWFNNFSKLNTNATTILDKYTLSWIMDFIFQDDENPSQINHADISYLTNIVHSCVDNTYQKYDEGNHCSDCVVKEWDSRWIH